MTRDDLMALLREFFDWGVGCGGEFDQEGENIAFAKAVAEHQAAIDAALTPITTYMSSFSRGGDGDLYRFTGCRAVSMETKMADLKQLHEQGKQITQDMADLKRGVKIEAESDEPSVYGALSLLERLTDIVARMEARDRQLRGEE